VLNYKLFELNNIDSGKGNLVVIENEKNQIPFDIKRLFYISGCNDDTVRGKHSNRNSEFIFICISGSCRIKLDDTNEAYDFLLDKPTKALYIDKLIWKEMYDFSKDAVLLVLSNNLYDEEEYIYDYNKLKNIMKIESASK